jgi:predicted RecA/RadA family phage recombinase
MKHLILLSGCVFAIVSSIAGTAHADPIVFSGSGAAATTSFNNFRLAVNIGNRIGWDGVRLDGTDANPATQVIIPNSVVAIPTDRFRNAGALYADPYAVAGDGFAGSNPLTTGEFVAFSPANTFAMFDFESGEFNDQFIEQSFVLPGTNTPAGTRGFGAIFLDVEIEGSSSIEYFGRTILGESVSLGKFDVEVGASGEPQFLGVVFDAPFVTDVILTVGTNALFSFDGVTLTSFGAENLDQGIDLVVTDDFVFAVPEQAQAVPEPSAMMLFGLGGLALMARHRRQ